MFKSKFLPVKVLSATEASVHTSEQVYPYPLLKEAYEHLNGNLSSNVIITKNGNITFASNPDILWFMVDVVKAYEYFSVARENKFSFLPIYDSKGVVALYASSVFKNTRLLVDAYTMNTVLVTKTQLIKRLSTMVDHKYNTLHLLDVFRYARLLEDGYKNFLDSWLVSPNADEGYMHVNPLSSLYADNNVWWAFDQLEELEKLVKGECTETETFVIQANAVDRKDMSKWQPMSMDWCKQLVTSWRKLEERNRSYVPILCDEDYMPICYVSTDLRHVVSAATGECLSVKNKSFRETLRNCLKQGDISRGAFYTLWVCLSSRDS